jgi:hypothetical protein
MKRSGLFILSIIISCICFTGTAQHVTDVSKPDLKLEANILVITYDILNSQPSDRFVIGVDVTGSNGVKIIPRTLTGEVGQNVRGGSKKVIRWDLASDLISMDQVLHIEIVGKKYIVEKETVVDGVQISRIGAIGRSLAFPGWGLSKVNPGKPHWIKGIAGFGSLAGTLILNQRAHVNYQNYLDSGDPDERENYYNKSITQEQFSNGLAIAAAGIWVADIIWTAVGTRNLSKKNLSMQRKGFSLGSEYESAGNIPMLCLKYAF